MAERKKSAAPAAKEAKPKKVKATASAESGKKVAAKASRGNGSKPVTTRAAAKPAAKPRARSAKGNGVTEEMRQHMIREAAYYRALNRGFGGTADMEDWLVAEQEISTMLGRLTG